MWIRSLPRTNTIVVDSLQGPAAICKEEAGGSVNAHGDLAGSAAGLTITKVLAVTGDKVTDLLRSKVATVGGGLRLTGSDPSQGRFAGEVRGGRIVRFTAGKIPETTGFRSGQGAGTG